MISKRGRVSWVTRVGYSSFHTISFSSAMPSIDATAMDSHIPTLPGVEKGLQHTITTEGLQSIADQHITKGLGRLRDHVFKEGKGLRVLTTVCPLNQIVC